MRIESGIDYSSQEKHQNNDVYLETSNPNWVEIRRQNYYSVKLQIAENVKSAYPDAYHPFGKKWLAAQWGRHNRSPYDVETFHLIFV